LPPCRINECRRIIDTTRWEGDSMTDSVLSPDGKMIWSGSEWIPIPTQSNTNVQDSVVMGDINTQIENSVHNNYTQDTDKLVRNHLHIATEKMEQGLFLQADEMYERSKQIDYQLATELYNGEFRDKYVIALWNELASHAQMSVRNIADRLFRILSFDEDHIPSLMLLAETSLEPQNDVGLRSERLQTAEMAYQRVLLIEPDNKEALTGLRRVESLMRIAGSSLRIGVFLIVLLIVAFYSIF